MVRDDIVEVASMERYMKLLGKIDVYDSSIHFIRLDIKDCEIALDSENIEPWEVDDLRSHVDDLREREREEEKEIFALIRQKVRMQIKLGL